MKKKILTYTTLFLLLGGGLTHATPNTEKIKVLSGKWQGICFISLGFFQDDPSLCGTDSTMVDLTIHQDGTVTGTVGQARLVDGYLKGNRGWLSRKLKWRTEFIIKGYLEGPIVDCDRDSVKKITLPFNLVNGGIKGTLFKIHKWKYPDPLIRILLQSVPTLEKSENE